MPERRTPAKGSGKPSEARKKAPIRGKKSAAGTLLPAGRALTDRREKRKGKGRGIGTFRRDKTRPNTYRLRRRAFAPRCGGLLATGHRQPTERSKAMAKDQRKPPSA